MLAFRVQNPHVLQADIALVAASNQPIPVNLRQKKVTTLKAMYVSNILLAKVPFRSPAKVSRATLEISALDRADLSAPPVIIEKRVTIPTPPTHAVEIRQN